MVYMNVPIIPFWAEQFVYNQMRRYKLLNKQKGSLFLFNKQLNCSY